MSTLCWQRPWNSVVVSRYRVILMTGRRWTFHQSSCASCRTQHPSKSSTHPSKWGSCWMRLKKVPQGEDDCKLSGWAAMEKWWIRSRSSTWLRTKEGSLIPKLELASGLARAPSRQTLYYYMGTQNGAHRWCRSVWSRPESEVNLASSAGENQRWAIAAAKPWQWSHAHHGRKQRSVYITVHSLAVMPLLRTIFGHGAGPSIAAFSFETCCSFAISCWNLALRSAMCRLGPASFLVTRGGRVLCHLLRGAAAGSWVWKCMKDSDFGRCNRNCRKARTLDRQGSAPEQQRTLAAGEGEIRRGADHAADIKGPHTLACLLRIKSANGHPQSANKYWWDTEEHVHDVCAGTDPIDHVCTVPPPVVQAEAAKAQKSAMRKKFRPSQHGWRGIPKESSEKLAGAGSGLVLNQKLSTGRKISISEGSFEPIPRGSLEKCCEVPKTFGSN